MAKANIAVPALTAAPAKASVTPTATPAGPAKASNAPVPAPISEVNLAIPVSAPLAENIPIRLAFNLATSEEAFFSRSEIAFSDDLVVALNFESSPVISTPIL